MAKTFRLNNLTGGINTVSEANDLITFTKDNLPMEARDIENWAPINRGGQQTAFGFALFKALGANKITGLYRYNKSDGTSLFLAGMGTKVYKIVGGVATDTGGTFANGSYLHFETAADKCVVCDGVSAPQFYDGTTWTTISNGAPVGARQSLWRSNRLWLYTQVSPNAGYMYYSKAQDITTGYDGTAGNGGFVQCDYNDGQVITSMANFFIPGVLQSTIIVGKTRSTGIITGDGSTGSPYSFAKVGLDYGVPGFRQMTQAGQLLFYLTPVGVSSYQVGNYQVNIFSQFISEKIRNQFALFNPAALKDALCWYDFKNTRISYALPEGTNITANVIWHYDIRLNCWYKERFGYSFDITASFIDDDGTWYHGDSSGNIYVHGSQYTTYSGNAILSYYSLPYLDFGAPSLNKEITEAEITLRTQGAYGIGVTNMQNYGTRNGSSNQINVTSSGYLWNGGVWSATPGIYQWGAATIKTKRFFPRGFFKNISFTINQNGLNQPTQFFELDLTVETEAAR